MPHVALDGGAALPHDMPMADKWITVSETSVFTRRAEKLLTPEEREDLITFLAANPEAGDEIQGTGGVRKVRFAAKGRGKSGGVRVIYYYYTPALPLYALLIYGKNEQANLTPDQERAMTAIVAAIRAKAKGRTP